MLSSVKALRIIVRANMKLFMYVGEYRIKKVAVNLFGYFSFTSSAWNRKNANE